MASAPLLQNDGLASATLGTGAVLLGAAAGVWCNFFYGWVFSSTFIVLTTPLLALAYGASFVTYRFVGWLT